MRGGDSHPIPQVAVRGSHRKRAIPFTAGRGTGLALGLPKMFSLTRFVFALALAASASLCAAGLGACIEPGDITVVAGVARYRDSGEFVHVSQKAYDSELGQDTRIDVWISKEAAEEYARITPDEHGSGARLPYGTVIIREVHDKKTSELLKLTLMVKGPEGVAPELDDWWYAVTDAVGVPLVAADGTPKRGSLPECRKCHEDRGEQDDFLFGVPDEVRAN